MKQEKNKHLFINCKKKINYGDGAAGMWERTYKGDTCRCNPHECKFRKHKENINIIWKNLETYQYSASQQTINDWVFWLQQYGVISGPSFPLLELNTGKYGPEITPYLDTFHAVNFLLKLVKIERNVNSNNYRNWTTCITRNAETHKSRNTLFL